MPQSFVVMSLNASLRHGIAFVREPSRTRASCPRSKEQHHALDDMPARGVACVHEVDARGQRLAAAGRAPLVCMR